jgi:hypothetical protein
MYYIERGEPDANKRRIYFHASSGSSPQTGQSGTPEISINGGSWTTSGISAVTEIDSSGYYYATLEPATVANDAKILARFDPASTGEFFERAMEGLIVVGGPLEALALLRNDRDVDNAAGTVKVYDGSGRAGGAGNALFTLTNGDGGTNITKVERS